MKMRSKLLSALLTFGLVISLNLGSAAIADQSLSATAETIGGAKFAPVTFDPQSPPGVSPEVYFEPSTKTYYLYTTAEQVKTYTSKDGLSWSEASNSRLPNGFDWSIVKMGENSYRLYYASIMPNEPASVRCSQQKKALFYATSTDLLNWTPATGPILSDVGCGVPHVLKKSDGKYLLYYNTITTEHGMHIQTSDDGIKWTAVPGIIAGDPQLVDPAPIEMPDGTFLMVASTTGGPQSGGLQRLQILSSKDGINWTHRKGDLHAPEGHSVLDPALKLIDGKLRVWHGYTKGMDHGKSQITSGELTLSAAGTKVTSPTKSKTKYCVKGKQKRVTESGKCPKGWKVKAK